MTDPTIQTPVGPGIDATGSIVVSLSEIDAMVRKAARGAGYAWGMAEEAGRAARWLSARGIDAAGLAANLFDEVDGCVGEFAPDVAVAPWISARGILCPITAGTALSDRAAMMLESTSVHLGKTMYPVILAPFLVWVAQCRGAVQLAAEGISVTLLPGGPLDSSLADVAGIRMSTVSVAVVAPEGEVTVPPVRGVPVDVRDWRRLDSHASRTYVPATDRSRKSGAGAGTTDND